MEIALITGISGSGKSVAIRALEDAGYYCVDNLPPELLTRFLELENEHRAERVAIAMDVRSAASLHLVPEQLDALHAQGVAVRLVFLDASTETIMRRYSETRRRHPLSSGDVTDERRALNDAIELERRMLATLREKALVIDTSVIRPSQLQANIKSVVSVAQTQLTLVFESFAFKRGVPLDADFVFDVRMLPNPHYEPALRELTGRDAEVVEFLRGQTDVQEMFRHIRGFLERWLGAMARDHRSYVTVAVGCTGGQHRSVFLVEELARTFSGNWITLRRHREIDSHPQR